MKLASVAGSATSLFLGSDEATKGAWRGAYGSSGYAFPDDSSGTNPQMPGYASLEVSGASVYVWEDASTSPYAPERIAGGGAHASCWYAQDAFELTLTLTDGRAHRLSVYATDWDLVSNNGNPPRNQRIDLIDHASGQILDTRTITSFRGIYLSWSVSASAAVRVTNLLPAGPGDSNGVISGLFLD